MIYETSIHIYACVCRRGVLKLVRYCSSVPPKISNVAIPFPVREPPIPPHPPRPHAGPRMISGLAATVRHAKTAITVKFGSAYEQPKDVVKHSLGQRKLGASLLPGLL